MDLSNYYCTGKPKHIVKKVLEKIDDAFSDFIDAIPPELIQDLANAPPYSDSMAARPFIPSNYFARKYESGPETRAKNT